MIEYEEQEDGSYGFSFEIEEKEKYDITLPKKLANEIEYISKSIAFKNNFTGFRLQRQLQVLAMANALSNKRNVVNNDDIDMIKEISLFINFDFKQI